MAQTSLKRHQPTRMATQSHLTTPKEKSFETRNLIRQIGPSPDMDFDGHAKIIVLPMTNDKREIIKLGVQTPKSTVEILIEAPAPKVRHREPVTCGIPWRKGMLHDPNYLVLRDEKGESIPVQTRILDRWPDRSVRWLLLDWQATVNGDTRYRLSMANVPSLPSSEESRQAESGIRVWRRGMRMNFMTVSTGAAQFYLGPGGLSLELGGLPESAGSISGIFLVHRQTGFLHPPYTTNLQVLEQGPVKVCIRLTGLIYRRFAKFEAYFYFSVGSPSVRVFWSICNSERARHRGGKWQLGDKQSIFLKDASFTIKFSEFHNQIKELEREREVAVAERFVDLGYEIDSLWVQDHLKPVHEWEKRGRFLCSSEARMPSLESHDLYQDSSGGLNWKNSNHVNRNGVVANSFCGYRFQTVSGQEQTGRRATPIVTLEQDGQMIGL